MRTNLDVTVTLPPTKLFDDTIYEVSLGGAIFNPNNNLGWQTFVIDGLRVYDMWNGLQLDSFSRSKLNDHIPEWSDYSVRFYIEQIVIQHVRLSVACDDVSKEAKNGS